MISKVRKLDPVNEYDCCVGDLRYGTLITGVTGHPSSLYIKVDKHSLGRSLTLNYKRDCSVLLNIKSGTLRLISGATVVRVLDGDLEARPQPAVNCKKDTDC